MKASVSFTYLLVSAVVRSYAKSCGSSLSGSSYGSDWGSAPTSEFTTITCLRVRNDSDSMEREEVAYSSIPMSNSLNLMDSDLDRLVVVGAGTRRIPSQFYVISRWSGPVTDTSRPIKWLKISIPVLMTSSNDATFDLRVYSSPQLHLTDGNDLTTTQNSKTHTVSTNGVQFTLNEDSPALLSSIDVDGSTILSTSPDNGPSISFFPHGTSSSVVSLTASEASVTYFEASESGPVKATYMIEGTFADPSGRSLCPTFNSYYVSEYESFTFSLALTFFRGRSNIHVQFHIRNQCSNADGSSWTDQDFTIRRASYSLDFSQGMVPSSVSHHYGGPSDTSVSSGTVAGSNFSTIVEQRRGSGNPWRRRSRVREGSSNISTGEYYNAPLVAISNNVFVIGCTLAYMRFREPQALRLVGSVASLDVVSEDQIVGEGKELWNHGSFFIERRSSQTSQDTLQSIRWKNVMEIERGLLLHSPCSYYSETGAMPPLGLENAVATSLKTSYETMIRTLHDDTLNQQIPRAKTYGSQIWPDIQFDGYNIDNNNPAENDPRHGYWNPHASEFVEFFRSGDPRWVWDFAMPLSWLMGYTAYLNIGKEEHDYFRNGLCINSGGSGDGQWHRSGFGSDDYMYNLAMKHAYVIRPDPIHRRRLEMTGRTVRLRYSRSTAEGDRDIYMERLDISRGVIQHMEAGLNCAEFAQSGGNQCNVWFLAVMSEFIEDNLSTGSICQPDVVSGNSCPQAQTFMQISMMYEFFVRSYLHYGDMNNGGLRKAVLGIPEGLYNHAIDKSGTSINYRGNHAYLLSCTTNGDRSALNSCSFQDAGDGLYLYEHNLNSLMSALLLGSYFGSTIDFCNLVENALMSSSVTWGFVFVAGAGYTKGSSQMLSLLGYGVGMLDLCNETTFPPSPVSSPTKAPIPSPSPVSSPTTSSNCIDSPLKMLLNKRQRGCWWVKQKTSVRCTKKGVASHCALTCASQLSDCNIDSTKKFFLPNGKRKSCIWVAKNKGKRCKRVSIKETCRSTCSS